MPVITLPDGSQKNFESPITVMQVAEAIGPGLARATLAGKIDDRLVDASYLIEHDAALTVVTDRDEAGLNIIRHSCAHLMAQAVKQLFPDAGVTIGPVIDNGFYYDFAYRKSFEPEDLRKIETRMKKLAKADLPVSRFVLPKDEAIQFFRNAGEHYKAEIIASIPDGQELSFYKQGDFTDLCRGPHVPSTGKLKAFKLTKLAGAYWRGDANNEMLQRIYGTAWQDKKALKAYLHLLDEAEKRDHRKIGRRLGLFHFQPEAPGMVFWHEKGWCIYTVLEHYIRDKLKQHDYQEVHTPQMIDRSLWEKSGHWDKFSEQMFTTQSEHRTFAIKPMNCPAHIQLFNQGLKSYRDLPLRLAEFGVVHRNEASGTLHGLMRARCFTQDDAHIFCSTDQLHQEIIALIDLTLEAYADFGFDAISIAVSTRPERSVGSEEQWERAEFALREAVQDKKLAWKLQPGEGAFYGPKIEFVLHDSIGRSWQCGTIQVDFSMAANLGASYVAEDGAKRAPVMIHRAILGSMERFIGILIEHYAGAFPTWLAPVQAVVNSLTRHQADDAEQIAKRLKEKGFRVEHDLRNETIGLKIREHTMQRVPYILVVGAREVENKTVAVRMRDGTDLGNQSVDGFALHLEKDITERSRSTVEE